MTRAVLSCERAHTSLRELRFVDDVIYMIFMSTLQAVAVAYCTRRGMSTYYMEMYAQL